MNTDKTVELIITVLKFALLAILGMAVGYQFNAEYGFMAFVSVPIIVWIIREIKA